MNLIAPTEVTPIPGDRLDLAWNAYTQAVECLKKDPSMEKYPYSEETEYVYAYLEACPPGISLEIAYAECIVNKQIVRVIASGDDEEEIEYLDDELNVLKFRRLRAARIIQQFARRVCEYDIMYNVNCPHSCEDCDGDCGILRCGCFTGQCECWYRD
jgi:hypothetical protein